MVRIAPVNLPLNPKTFWFNAGDMELHPGDAVVVTTVRGTEIGTVANPVFEKDYVEVKRMNRPLKDVVRLATQEDLEKAEQLEQQSMDALVVFREYVDDMGLDMRPISVEYLLDGDKAVFYFEAENRIDFRELVRRLASRFHIRVDMRQIGARDEARMLGGYGHCGQQLCCARLGSEFKPVSIRMAKEQDLSLNPQKISGVCGRLMCCLRYEFDAYKDFKSRAPKVGATIDTPDGPAKVASMDVPKEVVNLRIELDGKMKTIHVPLSSMSITGEGKRANTIGKTAWEEAIRPPEMFTLSANFLTNQFKGSDALGDGRAVRRNRANMKNATGSSSNVAKEGGGSRRKRKRRGGGGKSEDASGSSVDMHRRRRRRSSDASTPENTDSHSGNNANGARDSKRPSASSGGKSKRQRRSRASEASNAAGGGPRPGQKSSALSHQGESAAGEGTKKRRRRRRGGSQKKDAGSPSNGAQAAARPEDSGKAGGSAEKKQGSKSNSRRRRRGRGRGGSSKTDGSATASSGDAKG